MRLMVLWVLTCLNQLDINIISVPGDIMLIMRISLVYLYLFLPVGRKNDYHLRPRRTHSYCTYYAMNYTKKQLVAICPMKQQFHEMRSSSV